VEIRAQGLSEVTDLDLLDPSQDAKGAGYQQIQASITVGSEA